MKKTILIAALFWLIAFNAYGQDSLFVGPQIGNQWAESTDLPSGAGVTVGALATYQFRKTFIQASANYGYLWTNPANVFTQALTIGGGSSFEWFDLGAEVGLLNQNGDDLPPVGTVGLLGQIKADVTDRVRIVGSGRFGVRLREASSYYGGISLSTQFRL